MWEKFIKPFIVGVILGFAVYTNSKINLLEERVKELELIAFNK